VCEFFDIKGTVQRKLTGVVSYINREVFHSHWTANILFLKLWGTCSLNRKKPVSAAKAKICGLSNSMGHPLQRTDSGKPIQIYSWKYSCIFRWKPVPWFAAAIGLPLLTDSGNWRTANNSLELQQEAHSRYRHNIGKPISAISWLAYRYQLFAADAPLNWISHIFWL
jgi:hypothetical protein